MTKKQCPLGEACDLTTAWMAGRQHAIDWFAPIIEAKDAEIERLRAYLDRIEKASEFFTNPEHSELTLSYAHESTRRLAREALTGDKS